MEHISVFCSTVHEDNFSPNQGIILDDFRKLPARSGFECLAKPTAEIHTIKKGAYCKVKGIDILLTDFIFSKCLEHQWLRN